jgi:uncharacterized membrane protein
MPGFIDDLGLVLDLMILVTAAVFYTGVMVWFETSRKDTVRALSHLRSGALLLGLLGGVIFLISIVGELTWPFGFVAPLSSYNPFFFDPLLLMAILLMAFPLALRFRYPTHFVGMLGVIVGMCIAFYGTRGYQLGLTKDPLETFLMYLAWAAMAIGIYPATLYVDWFVVGPTTPGTDPLPSPPTPNYPKMWWVLLGLFMFLVVLAGVAAVLYGINTAWSHLSGPP